jgi:hypothetical protein
MSSVQHPLYIPSPGDFWQHPCNVHSLSLSTMSSLMTIHGCNHHCQSIQEAWGLGV